MVSTEHVLIERQGAVVTVIMNRPAARNAMDLEMLARMADAWQQIDADPDVRVAILTGAGGHFSSGSDLKAMSSGHHDPVWSPRFKADPDFTRTAEWLEAIEKGPGTTEVPADRPPGPGDAKAVAAAVSSTIIAKP